MAFSFRLFETSRHAIMGGGAIGLELVLQALSSSSPTWAQPIDDKAEISPRPRHDLAISPGVRRPAPEKRPLLRLTLVAAAHFAPNLGKRPQSRPSVRSVLSVCQPEPDHCYRTGYSLVFQGHRLPEGLPEDSKQGQGITWHAWVRLRITPRCTWGSPGVPVV